MSHIDIAQEIVIGLPQETVPDTYLSVPAWDQLNGGYGLCRDNVRGQNSPKKSYNQNGLIPFRGYDEFLCVLPYEAHLRGCELKPGDQWLLIGARNLGNNLRIIAYKNNDKLRQEDSEESKHSKESGLSVER